MKYISEINRRNTIKYRVDVTYKGKQRYIGSYSSMDEAIAARNIYCKARGINNYMSLAEKRAVYLVMDNLITLLSNQLQKDVLTNFETAQLNNTINLLIDIRDHYKS